MMPQAARQTDVTINWDQWIPIDEAARRLDVSEGHLRRVCANDLAGSRMAVHGRAPEGGNPKWWIWRQWDQRLKSGPIGLVRPADALAGYTAKQLRTARQREQCVIAFDQARASWTGAVDDWIDTLLDQLRGKYARLRISRSSLYNWSGNYDGDPANLEKLIDKRGGNRKSNPDPAAIQRFKELYMHRNQRSLRHCYRRVREESRERKWRCWSSEAACRRWVEATLAEQDVIKARVPDDYKIYLRPFTEQDPEGFSAGECWVGDNMQFDVIVRVKTHKGEYRYVRPVLTAWVDWRTRRVMAWSIAEIPNSTTILAALRHGLMDLNLITLPAHVWIDNGKDFCHRMFHGQTKRQRREDVALSVDEPMSGGILGALQITPHFSIPFNPNGKSRCERWFDSVHQHFDKCYPTYCGGVHEDRPEYLNDLIKRDVAVPDYEDFVAHFAQHVRGYNASAEHDKPDMAGYSPDRFLSERCMARRVLADPAALDELLMRHHEPKTVGRNGISIQIAGRTFTYGQCEHALVKFKAKHKKDRPPVWVSYDPHDTGYLRVYDEQMRFVCVAPLNEKHGHHGGAKASEKALREQMARIARYNKADRFVKENRELEYKSLHALAAEADQPPPPRPNPDANLIPIQTHFDGVSNDPSKAIQRRAVGADPDPMPSMSMLRDEDDEDYGYRSSFSLADLTREDEP